MPYTPPSTADTTMIINRPRPPTWVFLPPSDEPESTSDSDALPPYPPPPTRPPPRTPLTPPAQIHIPSPTTSNFNRNSYEYEYNSTSTINRELKASSAANKEPPDFPPFCKALLFDSLQTNLDSLGPPSPSISPSVSSQSSKPPTPQPWFHPISHRQFPKASVPRTRDRPPSPLIQSISASEFYISSLSPPDYYSQQQLEEEDTNDWVIIPPDVYSLSSSPSSSSPSSSSPSSSSLSSSSDPAALILHKNGTTRREECRGTEGKMIWETRNGDRMRIALKIGARMSTKGYTSTGSLKLAYQEDKENGREGTKDLIL
ncbi:uncharacterized protein EAF01_008995 [Botrytis porri]|uniref:uncharacterized protein n=1 Tax=Botrytis porri TaxID=87229 RepID=UPI0019010080|nr:uncharacterized protein EAF01_008995 [Botrytis porri]KAF7898029.1 hypothetical protein EAF01_008995 [Botrytis porri]